VKGFKGFDMASTRNQGFTSMHQQRDTYHFNCAYTPCQWQWPMAPLIYV